MCNFHSPSRYKIVGERKGARHYLHAPASPCSINNKNNITSLAIYGRTLCKCEERRKKISNLKLNSQVDRRQQLHFRRRRAGHVLQRQRGRGKPAGVGEWTIAGFMLILTTVPMAHDAVCCTFVESSILSHSFKTFSSSLHFRYFALNKLLHSPEGPP